MTISHDSSFKEIVNDVNNHNIVNIIESKVAVIVLLGLYISMGQSLKKEQELVSC